MRKSETPHLILILVLIGLILSGCSKSHSLMFDILLESTAFKIVDFDNLSLPSLMVITSTDEMDLPITGVQVNPALLKILEEVDYDKYFVVILNPGHIPDNETISEILVRGKTVRIKLQKYTIGPGNYMLREWTSPYQIIAVNKGEFTWGDDFDIVLENEGEILSKEQHYIP